MSQVVVVTGVTAAGKTTVGKALAARLGWDFFDADHYHSEANVRLMSDGIPLTDHDRQPWLESLKALIDIRLREGAPAVLACSALKAAYRDTLAAGRDSVQFVLLKVEAATLRSRMDSRTGHFMNPDLLQSQIDAFEPDETLIPIDAGGTVVETVEQIIDLLELEAAG